MNKKSIQSKRPSEHRPPKLADRLLAWFCKPELLEEILGDLHADYERRRDRGWSAELRYWKQVLNFLRPFALKKIGIIYQLNKYTMFDHYIKTYRRVAARNKSFSLITILGLSLGFAVLLLIRLYVHEENHIDAYHSKADRIYRYIENESTTEGIKTFSSVSQPIALALKNEFPQIEEVANVMWTGSNTLKRGETLFWEQNYASVTPGIFKIWDINVLQGNPLKEFNGEAGLVLTKSTAEKLFGKEDPIGQVVEATRRYDTPVEVIAVIEDFPKNSTFQFGSMYVTDLNKIDAWWIRDWDFRLLNTWVLFKEGTKPESVMASKQSFLDKYFSSESHAKHDFDFQNIKDIHFGSLDFADRNRSVPPMTILPSNTEFVQIVNLVGYLVMVLTALNFVNLSSIHLLKRQKELMVKKVNGATNSQIIQQLLFELSISVLLGYGFGMLITWLAFYPFMLILGKSIPFSFIFGREHLQFQVVSLLIVWLSAALAPLLYYARSLWDKKPIGRSDLMRKVFTGVQYCISFSLAVGALVLYQQLNYVQTKDLGFTREGLLNIQISSGPMRQNHQNIASELLSHPQIKDVAVSSRIPGDPSSKITIQCMRKLTDPTTEVIHYGVDDHWLSTYDIELLQGENFAEDQNFNRDKIIINQKLADIMGWEEPVGQSLYLARPVMGNDTIRALVIGVVKDFNTSSLYENMEPIIMTSKRNPYMRPGRLTIKFTGNPVEVLTLAENLCLQHDPNTPPKTHFMDDHWNTYYEHDISRSKLVLIATLIAIIISALGLFGLVNYSAQRRTKEIGIRKVLGARVSGIFYLILKEFSVLMVVALLVSVPFSYLAISNWLDGFAYRINFSAFVYVLGAAIIFLVSFLTVLQRVTQLSQTNPVQCLRDE